MQALANRPLHAGQYIGWLTELSYGSSNVGNTALDLRPLAGDVPAVGLINRWFWCM